VTRQELQGVVDNPLSDEQQRADARALLDKLNTVTGEFVPNAEMWANYARSFRDSACRAQIFGD